MGRRTCRACGVEKNEEEFPWKRRSSAAPLRKRTCRACLRAYSRARRSERREETNAYAREYRKKRRETLRGHLAQALTAKRSWCRRKNIPCTITVGHLRDLYEEQNGLCCLTWRKLEWGSDRRRRFSLSLDRFDSYNGYVPGNVRLVTLHANVARSDFGDSALLQLAEDLCRAGALLPSGRPLPDGLRKPDWGPRRVQTPEGGVKVVFWSKQMTPDNKLKRTPPERERTQIMFYGNCEDEK